MAKVAKAHFLRENYLFYDAVANFIFKEDLTMGRPLLHEYDVIRASVAMNSVRGGNDAGYVLVEFGELLGEWKPGYFEDGIYMSDDRVIVKSVTLFSDKPLPDGTIDYKIILEAQDWESMLDFLSRVMKRFTCVEIERIWTCERYAELNPEKG